MATDESKVEQIFFCALEQGSAEELAAYLDEACEGDEPLRNRVQRLLDAKPKLGSFLQGDAGDIIATVDQPITEKPGTQIGPYKLLQQIGEGGMGVVYMAEQKEPVKRRVALKIIKPGMDTRQVIARFEAERQALAMMDHPNIAKVLDAGQTESGRPYFVMELVKGMPVTNYCDEQHLTPKERLELFVPICQAVQHAHQKGIIHRDLKPSNILVALYDGRAVPKIIDFGVAKATNQTPNEKTMFTQYGQVVGTIEYMSPEQAQLNQMDIDTRSDIYSLGVLLYELLAGQSPFDRERLRSAAFEEVLRIVREEEPPRPSVRLSSSDALASIAATRQIEPKKLSVLVRGDLDWIVMKAMEKDRARRYETANGLAADIRRHLNEEPVVARPPSASYRFKKFARRNRGGLAIASVVAFAMLLIVGTVAGSIGWAVRNRAAIEEQVAREHAARELIIERTVESALKASTEHMQEKIWDRATAEARRAQAAFTGETGLGELRRLVKERLNDVAMVTRLEQIRLEQSTLQDGTGRLDWKGTDQRYAVAFRDYGVDLQRLDTTDLAKTLRDKSISEELATALDGWAEIRRHALELDESTWKPLIALSKAIDADPLRSRLRELWEQPVTDDTDEALAELIASRDLHSLPAATCIRFAEMLSRRGREREAVDVLRRAQQVHPGDFWLNYCLGHFANDAAMQDEALRFHTAATALRPDTAVVHNDLGCVLHRIGELDEAIREYRIALDYEPEWARAHYNLGTGLWASGNFAAAEQAFEDALAIDPQHASAHSMLAWVLERKGDLEGAIKEYEKATDLDPSSAATHNNFGIALKRKGDLDGAIQQYRKSIELDPENILPHSHLAVVLRTVGDLEGATQQWKRVIEIDPQNVRGYAGLGNTLRSQGKFEEAARAFQKAADLRPEEDDPTPALWGVYGQALYRVERYREAKEALETVIRLKHDEGPTAVGGPRWVFYIMALWQLGETGRAEAYFTQLNDSAQRELPENMKPLVEEAAELLGVENHQTEEPDDVD